MPKACVERLLSSVNRPRKQALILNHYGIALPSFPTMLEVGFVDQDRWFCVAGGRVQALERESIVAIEALAEQFKTDELYADCQNMAEGGDSYAMLLISIWEKRGTYIEHPASRPSDWDGKTPTPNHIP